MEDLEKFEQFFRQFYDKELRDAARQGKKSIIVDFALLDKFDPIFADKLLNEPGAMLVQARKAIAGIDLPEGSVSIEPRFKNLPEQQNIRIRNLRSQHIGQFVCIDGVIRRAAEVKPEISVATFQCPDCATKIQIEQTDRILKSPALCECGRKGKFPLVSTELFDARWITVEEPFEIATGERPGEVSVYLKNDLTAPEMQRRTDPGNRIVVNGIVNEIRKIIKGRMRTQLDIFIEANYIEQTEVEWEEVEISSEDEAQIKQLAADPNVYEKLVGSIAPSIYGMEEIKQAIVLQLFGGVPHTLPDKVKIRGDIHILLLGDPSCLVADERIVLSDGTIMKIGQMGSAHLQKINYNVHLGMGRNAGKAKIFHAYEKQPIIEIITETGKSLKGTPNQPVLIIKNMQQFWKRLDEVKVGDKVQVLPKIECRKKSFVETNWKDYPYYHKSWHIKVPKFVNEELAGLFGYILADGWVQNRRVGFIINKDEADIFPKIKNAFGKCFGTSVSTYKHIRASPKISYYQVDRSHVAKLLSFLNEKRVPDLIFSSGNLVVASFLRWLYEGDGCVFSKGRGRLSVSLKSNNIELLRDVQILLLRFGIHSRILWEDKKRSAKIKGREITASPSGSLMIRRSESVIKFWQNIGFISKKKKSKLRQAARYAKSHVHRIHKSRSEKIVKINKLQSQDVFDIEVPKYHRFVANGIVVHNTAKSQLLKLISQIIPRGKYVAGRGATAAGLCVSPDTLIMMEDGSFREIREIVESELKRGEREFNKNIKIASNPTKIKVLSFDSKELKIKPLEVTQYWKIKAPKKLIKIKTRLGKEIKVTPESPLPVLKNGKLIWKKAKDLDNEDFIATPRQIRYAPNSAIYVLNFLDKSAHLLNSKDVIDNILLKIREKNITIRDFANDIFINENLLYHSWRGGLHSPQLSILEKMCKKASLNLNDLLPEKLQLMQYKGHVINLPKKFNEDLLYLFGLVAGDGSISKTAYNGFSIKFHSADNELLDSFSKICKEQIGAHIYYYKHPERIAYWQINSKIIGQLMNKFGIPNGKKSHNIKITNELSRLPNNLIVAYLQGIFDTDGSVIERKAQGPSYIEITSSSKEFLNGIQFLLLRFNIISKIRQRNGTISYIRGRKVKSGKKYALEIKGLENLNFFKEKIGFRFSKKASKLKKITKKISKIDTNIDIIPTISQLLKSTRAELGISAKQLYGYKNYSYEKNIRRPSKQMLQKIVKRLKKIKITENVRLLEKFAFSDIFWDKVTEIKAINYKDKCIYDLTVENEHSFVANGMIVHNTATVVKDEFMGGWVLEAGAMVLANKGVLAIDEFDKMSKEDQIAMHEALEQQTVSIAKASIIATLPAQVSVLAGSNPKLSRFDPYRPIAQQIDIPDTLLSRFDLKFALMDIPETKKDELLATHILETRLKPSKAKPLLAPEFLRKYVAYARKNCAPKPTREALEKLKQFYIDMRGLYIGQDVVPITLRQNEALLRLTEASAKIRLSDKVSMEDAERAISVMKFSLQQLGYDYETRKFDIDRTEGVPSSQRSKILALIDIINKLEKQFGKQIPREEIIASAEDEGITLKMADEILQRLKHEGMIFEPRQGFVQRV